MGKKQKWVEVKVRDMAALVSGVLLALSAVTGTASPPSSILTLWCQAALLGLRCAVWLVETPRPRRGSPACAGDSLKNSRRIALTVR